MRNTLLLVALLGLAGATAATLATPTASAIDCVVLIDPVTGEPHDACDPLGICQTSLGDKLTYCHLT